MTTVVPIRPDEGVVAVCVVGQRDPVVRGDPCQRGVVADVEPVLEQCVSNGERNGLADPIGNGIGASGQRHCRDRRCRKRRLDESREQVARHLITDLVDLLRDERWVERLAVDQLQRPGPDAEHGVGPSSVACIANPTESDVSERAARVGEHLDDPHGPTVCRPGRRCGGQAADRQDSSVMSGGSPEQTSVRGRPVVPGADPLEHVDDLVAEIRSTAFRFDESLVARIDAAIDAASSPREIGRLLVAKTLAVQGRGDPATAADLSRRAVPLLVAAGDLGHAAYASTMAAVFLDQAGQAAVGIEHAVDALVLLDDLVLDEIDVIRASLALAGFYVRRCAFDIAVDLARRAFDGAVQVDGAPLDAVAYTSGYIAAEGAHVTSDPLAREAYIVHARTTATWLRTSGQDEISRTLLGPGLDAEADLAAGQPVDADELDAAIPLYDTAVADFVAWHQLVRGLGAAQRDDLHLAIGLLSTAEPGLRASADDHCLVRALRTRSEAKAALGDLAGAYADAVTLADLTRRWQIEQVGGLADQIGRRADLERSSSALRRAAQRLRADIDRDPLTGVHSRHWLERELDAIARVGGAGAVVMLDVDRFKSVNDTYGHHVGDRVLGRVGELMRAASGAHPVARFGGEEFAVVIRCADAGPAIECAERIRREIEAFDWGAEAAGIALTISAGVAAGELADVRAIIVRADEALLCSKRNGRNRVTLSEPAPAPPRR